MGIGRGAASHKLLVRVRHEKTDNGEGDDIEERDTPEHLLDSGRQGLARVRRLGRSQANQLCTGEGESRVDKDTAQALEAVVEGARVVPVAGTDVAALRTTTTVQDDSEDARNKMSATIRVNPVQEQRYSHETNDGSDLDDGKDELGLTVALDTKHVDRDNQHPEDAHPRGIGDTRAPVIDGDRRGDDFQRQDNQPLESIVPAHSETPGGIEEACRVVREGTGDGKQHSHLTQSLDGAVQHRADEDIGNKHRRRTTCCQHGTRTNEQTSTWERI